MPLELGNYVLILVGVALVFSGPYITYRTIKGVRDRRKADPTAKLQVFSNGLNFVIAIVFSMAGVLFIINNLRGNPLALTH